MCCRILIDIKPENIRFRNASRDAPLVLVDYGSGIIDETVKQEQALDDQSEVKTRPEPVYVEHRLRRYTCISKPSHNQYLSPTRRITLNRMGCYSLRGLHLKQVNVTKCALHTFQQKKIDSKQKDDHLSPYF